MAPLRYFRPFCIPKYLKHFLRVNLSCCTVLVSVIFYIYTRYRCIIFLKKCAYIFLKLDGLHLFAFCQKDLFILESLLLVYLFWMQWIIIMLNQLQSYSWPIFQWNICIINLMLSSFECLFFNKIKLMSLGNHRLLEDNP